MLPFQVRQFWGLFRAIACMLLSCSASTAHSDAGNEATELLISADLELDSVHLVQGEFIYEELVAGVTSQTHHGKFRVRRRVDLPSLFEVRFLDADATLKRRIWSDGQYVYHKAESGSVTRTSIFRGGMQKYGDHGLSIGDHFVQAGYFEKLTSYSPSYRQETVASEAKRSIEVVSPQKRWTYRFDALSPLLREVETESMVDGKSFTVRTRYLNCQFSKGSDWTPLPSSEKERMVTQGPYDSLLGKDCSSVVVQWGLDRSGSLAECDGKLVVIDFWASWCAPCMREMKGFVDLSQQYSTDEVRFICSPWNDSDKRAKQVSEAAGYRSLIHRVAPDQFGLERTGIPCVVIVDKTGRIADLVVGSHGAAGKQHLKRILDSLLAK